MFNSRKKKLLFGLGATLVAIAAGLAVYAILVTPSRQPYRDAQAQYKNVYNANVNVIMAGSSINASSATDEAFEKSLQTVEATLKSLTAENDALGKEAVLQDGEGKSLYDTFTEKLTAYIAYNNDLVASMRQVRPVVYSCSLQMAAADESSTGVAEMRSCAKSFADLEDVANPDYQTLVSTSQALYAKFADNLEARAALKDPNGNDKKAYDALSSEQEDILEDLSDASTTFSTNLQTHKNEVDITNEAMALDDYLSKKSSIFKG